MQLHIGGYLIFAGLLWFPMTDGSGQDARFYGRRADHESLLSGKIGDALELYQRAYRNAVAASDTTFQRRFLNNIGACQLGLFRYNEAEHTLLLARSLAQANRDDMSLGSADGNLAAVYAQMDDLPNAESYAREALSVCSRNGKWNARVRASLTLAGILSRRQLTAEGERFFQAGISEAIDSRDWASASDGWLHYGKVLLDNNRLQAADHAFAQSERALHKSGRLSGEDAILWNLSQLHLRRHDYTKALALASSAIQVAPRVGGRIPLWQLYQARAKAELATGDASAALQDARTALLGARTLRANIVPGNDDRIGIEGVLDEVFSVLIDAGNLVAMHTGDRKLLRETFEASEENRAESLEALLPASGNWRAALATPAYRYKLSQMAIAQRRGLVGNSSENLERMARLHTELSQMEAAAGVSIHPRKGAILDRVTDHLPAGSSLLSFRLGERASWLWVVERGELHLYRLPRKAVLTAEIADLENSIRDNDTRRITRFGRLLYKDLFGARPRSFQQSSQWYLSVDASLYTLPFASLVVNTGTKNPVYLTERKTLEVLPGAQLFDSPQRGKLARRRFLLAGDGVYNRADPRYGKSGFFHPASWSMPRLPASGAEVRFAARLWPDRALLTGARLSKESLLKEIDRDPDVIHIASHVIEGQDRWRSGILALGIDPSGGPDLLSVNEIVLHPLHSRLVVMTGCASGSAEALPASGLMGLTRAWLAAGAGEVLATRWPTTDETGDGLIGRFYVHLLASPDGNIPEALRAARRDMIARGGWRAEPRYWSSFFLVGVR